MTIGFIGLGIMGTPMWQHLIQGGHELFVHTLGPMPAAIAATAATRCSSNRSVAEQAGVVVMVPDTPNVEEALFAADGAAAGLSPGKTVVDMSSISPIATRAFARSKAHQNVRLIMTRAQS